MDNKGIKGELVPRLSPLPGIEVAKKDAFNQP